MGMYMVDLRCGGQSPRLHQHDSPRGQCERSRTVPSAKTFHLRSRYRLVLSARRAKEKAEAEPEPEPEPEDFSVSHERPASEDSRSTQALVYGKELRGGRPSSDDELCPLPR